MLIRTPIMNGSSVENDRLCRVLGYMRHGPPIDSEFNAPGVDPTPPGTPLFSYIRYGIDISQKGLEKKGLGDIDAKAVGRLDSIAAIDDLTTIGSKAAEEVDASHFVDFPRPKPRP